MNWAYLLLAYAWCFNANATLPKTGVSSSPNTAYLFFFFCTARHTTIIYNLINTYVIYRCRNLLFLLQFVHKFRSDKINQPNKQTKNKPLFLLFLLKNVITENFYNTKIHHRSYRDIFHEECRPRKLVVNLVSFNESGHPKYPILYPYLYKLCGESKTSLIELGLAQE